MQRILAAAPTSRKTPQPILPARWHSVRSVKASTDSRPFARSSTGVRTVAYSAQGTPQWFSRTALPHLAGRCVLRRCRLERRHSRQTLATTLAAGRHRASRPPISWRFDSGVPCRATGHATGMLRAERADWWAACRQSRHTAPLEEYDILRKLSSEARAGTAIGSAHNLFPDPTCGGRSHNQLPSATSSPAMISRTRAMLRWATSRNAMAIGRPTSGFQPRGLHQCRCCSK